MGNGSTVKKTNLVLRLHENLEGMKLPLRNVQVARFIGDGLVSRFPRIRYGGKFEAGLIHIIRLARQADIAKDMLDQYLFENAESVDDYEKKSWDAALQKIRSNFSSMIKNPLVSDNVLGNFDGAVLARLRHFGVALPRDEVVVPSEDVGELIDVADLIKSACGNPGISPALKVVLKKMHERLLHAIREYVERGWDPLREALLAVADEISLNRDEVKSGDVEVKKTLWRAISVLSKIYSYVAGADGLLSLAERGESYYLGIKKLIDQNGD